MAKALARWRGFIIFNLVGAILLVIGCGRPHKALTRYSEKKGLMGTVVQIDVCLDGEDQLDVDAAYTAMWERLSEISWRMNVYDPNSDVSKVNRAFPEAVEVGADTHAMLRRSVAYARETQGAFLISVWPLIKLWRASQESQEPPAADVLQTTLRQINLDQLVLKADNKVARLNRTISLDLGGIAKGYAVDEAARIFREHGFRNFYIDAGGDIYVGGLNCRSEKWRIGIKDPRDRQRIIETVAVSDQAVTTSGNYEQFLVINGERYSHIIDPATGNPQRDVVSATVIAPTAEAADVYSTALTVLGGERGTALIDRDHPEMASLIFTRQPNGNVVRTESRSLGSYQINR